MSLITVVAIVGMVLLIRFKIVDIDKIILTGNDYQYNIISLSSVIGGFLFTGIGILISAIDKDRIKRLWEYNYLDNLYRSSFCGIVCNVITIVLAFAYLSFSTSDIVMRFLVGFQTVLVMLGLVYFVWCVGRLMFILKRLKTCDDEQKIVVKKHGSKH